MGEFETFRAAAFFGADEVGVEDPFDDLVGQAFALFGARLDLAANAAIDESWNHSRMARSFLTAESR